MPSTNSNSVAQTVRDTQRNMGGFGSKNSSFGRNPFGEGQSQASYGGDSQMNFTPQSKRLKNYESMYGVNAGLNQTTSGVSAGSFGKDSPFLSGDIIIPSDVEKLKKLFPLLDSKVILSHLFLNKSLDSRGCLQ